MSGNTEKNLSFALPVYYFISHQLVMIQCHLLHKYLLISIRTVLMQSKPFFLFSFVLMLVVGGGKIG